MDKQNPLQKHQAILSQPTQHQIQPTTTKVQINEQQYQGEGNQYKLIRQGRQMLKEQRKACSKCRLQMVGEQVQQHEEQCGNLAQCYMCMKKIRLQDLDNHQGICQIIRNINQNGHSSAIPNLNPDHPNYLEQFLNNINAANLDYNNELQEILVNDVFPAFKNLQKGLKESEIQRLNMFAYPYGKSVEVECSICLDEMRQRTKVIELSCRHIFHKRCISDWLIRTSCCPNCNTPIK